MGSTPSGYSIMLSPYGAEHLSLCIQSFFFWSLSFRELALVLGREMNSRTCIWKSEVPLCVVLAQCSSIVSPWNLAFVLGSTWSTVPRCLSDLYLHSALENAQECIFCSTYCIWPIWQVMPYSKLELLHVKFFLYAYICSLWWCRWFFHSDLGLDSTCILFCLQAFLMRSAIVLISLREKVLCGIRSCVRLPTEQLVVLKPFDYPCGLKKSVMWTCLVDVWSNCRRTDIREV